jgi:hypothetical protein
LVRIIDNALEAGLLLAANEADVDSTGVLHRKAVDIDTVMLVEKVEDVRERRRLEVRLKQFRLKQFRERSAWQENLARRLLLAVSTINRVYVDDACGVRGGDGRLALHRHFWWPGMQIPPSLHSITIHRLVCASIQHSVL